MSESLAVRHRPRRFADVGGQRHVSAVLRSFAARQDPSPQTLLSGGSGLGKTTLARIFVAALFCLERTEDGDACGRCQECQDVTGRGLHPDLIELDAASNGGKDEIREIAQQSAFAPLRARWKVYLIDEAHGVSGAGGQAMLKLLEEPPPHVLFILATTDPEKLPTAVRGRCTVLEVLPPAPEEVRANLMRVAAGEGWDLGEDALACVLAASDPALGMRGTVMTLEKLSGPLSAGRQPSAQELETLLGSVAPSRLAALTAAIEDGSRGAALSELAALSGAVGTSLLRTQLTAWARQKMLESAMTAAGAETYRRFEVLVNAGQYEGALEVAVARMACPALDPSPAAMLALVERAEALLAAGTLPAPPPAAPVSATPAAPVAAPAAAPVLAPAAPPAAAPANSPAAPSAPVGTLEQATLTRVLNALGRVSGRAGILARRCATTMTPEGGVVFTCPPGTPGRDALVLAVEAVTAAGTSPVPVSLA